MTSPDVVVKEYGKPYWRAILTSFPAIVAAPYAAEYGESKPEQDRFIADCREARLSVEVWA